MVRATVGLVQHKVAGIGHESSIWIVRNEFASQPLRLRLELLMSVKSYNDAENIVLTDFSQENDFTNREFAEGVVATLNPSEEKTFDNETAAAFSAYNLGALSQDASWAKIEKRFDLGLNLENNQALGIWVKGDGNGELLNVRLESPEHLSYGAYGDHFINVDFTGWKYVELVEIESSAYSNYAWPIKDHTHNHVYNTYRNILDFSNINKLQFWYNNIPKGAEVNCVIGPVKALPLVANTIENPTITIGNETVTFPVRMESGMYLELTADDECVLYGSKGEELKRVKIKTKIPTLISGENNISFSCEETKRVNTRAQVTVISQGKAL